MLRRSGKQGSSRGGGGFGDKLGCLYLHSDSIFHSFYSVCSGRCVAVRGACREYTSFLFDEDHLGWATRATSEMSNLLWSLDTCALRDYYRQAEVRQRRLSTAFQCCGVVPQARSEAAGRAVNAVAPIKGQHVGSVVFSELVSFRITLAVIPTILPTMVIRFNVVLFFAFVLVKALPVSLELPPPE